jgi:hypothetical protein
MPAIQLYSGSLTAAPNKVLVETSDVNEEATGIVRAGITYVCKGADAEAVSERMTLDTEPPVYPVTIFRNQMQRGRLYQYQRTIENRYGVAKIRGLYVGVLKRGQQPQLKTETETFSATFPLTFEDIGRLTGIFDAQNRFQLAFPDLYTAGLRNGANAVAIVNLAGRSNILQRRFGAIVDDARAANSIAATTLDQLIVTLSANIIVAPVYEQWLLTIFGLSAPQTLTNSRTPIEWLKAFPNRYSISSDITTDFITPSVAIFSGNARLSVSEAPAITFPTVTTSGTTGLGQS